MKRSTKNKKQEEETRNRNTSKNEMNENMAALACTNDRTAVTGKKNTEEYKHSNEINCIFWRQSHLTFPLAHFSQPKTLIASEGFHYQHYCEQNG
jgi:hypothetical protein